ncbi:MAG: DNA-3-methyladenine glycosylase I [bacterium]|nr:DNA-3-methyladenine glycosylase I [bacterium]
MADLRRSDSTCDWPLKSPLMLEYHDTEWGVPLHDDRKLFEFMILDAMQAGLSWEIVLKKRENFRRALHNFDPQQIAGYTQADVDRLLQNDGIIRNRLKIQAAINNAQKFLEVQQQFGSFDAYIWQFVGGKPIVNRWETQAQIPTHSKESDAMSADLKQRGFKFVGSTICYAFMQAAGMVNDHLVKCSRWGEVGK